MVISPAPVSAQAPVPNPTPDLLGPAVPQEPPLIGDDVYTFNSIGINDRIMNGPYDYFRVNFSLPNNWALKPGAAVQLHLNNSFTSTSGVSQNDLIKATGATLDVTFNGVWITTLLLNWSGERTITIPIKVNAFSTAATTQGQQYLALSLNAGIDCKYQHQTTIAIMSDSRLDLQHNLTPPTIDLVKLPYPIYQPNSFILNNAIASSVAGPLTTLTAAPPAVLVTSDKPSEAEMRAALIVSAGFGRMSLGGLPLSTLPISELTDQIKNSSHLIFVGKGDGFTALNGIPLPVAYDGKNFKSPNTKPDDGLIQETVSPWDLSKVLLVISAESDAGIIKAAQAVSSGVIRVADRSDMAIVSDVNSGDLITSVPVDRSLGDLGYDTTQVTGVSIRTQDYLFYVPSGQTISEAAYFKLIFSDSAFLDFGQSGMSILLNGQSIGSIRYSAASAKTVTTEQINIPDYLLRSGMNKLTLQVNHAPFDYCSNLIINNLWTSISNQSFLHIPLTPAVAGVAGKPTLNTYANFLGSAPTLSSTAFVVAQNSPAAIKIASRVAYQLGSLMTGSLVELKAAYADNVPADFRTGHDLVLVGRASQLPMIAELGSNLPAPFDGGSDVAQETILRVIYRIPAGISVGYLEVLSAPWDSSRNILAVLGSTDDGLVYSANALTVPVLQKKLGGNYAVVRNEQVITGDTRLGSGTGNISGTLVPGAPQTIQVPTEIAIPAAGQPLPTANQTNWILLAVGISTALIILILLMVFIRSRQK